MAYDIDFYLIQSWEPIGQRVRVIESAETFAKRATTLMIRHRGVLDEGESPDPETDPRVASGLAEMAGQTMSDSELVWAIHKYLHASGWEKETAYGVACNIAFATLEEGDQFSYLEQD